MQRKNIHTESIGKKWGWQDVRDLGREHRCHV